MIGVKRIVRRDMLPFQVLEVLRERILDRIYAPSQRLNIDALVRELGVSSTPIRESLGHLVAEGLVDTAPFIGFSVAPIPADSYYNQLYDLRLVLEPWAAARTAEGRDKKNIETLRSLLASMDDASLSKRYRKFRTFTDADAAFHQAIVAGAANEPALWAYRALNVHMHLSRLFIDREQKTIETRRQHQEIFEAISDGNPSMAAQKMTEHLSHSKANLLGEPAVPSSRQTTTHDTKET